MFIKYSYSLIVGIEPPRELLKKIFPQPQHANDENGKKFVERRRKNDLEPKSRKKHVFSYLRRET